MAFVQDLLGGLVANLGEPTWWASELPSWIVFSLIVGAAVKFVETQRYKREREPYERWTLHVVGYNDPAQGLDPDEVRRFLNSSFEFWKFIKSTASGTHDLTLRSRDAAIDKWVMVNREAREITVDLCQVVPCGHGKLKTNAEAPRRPAAQSETTSQVA